jgi:hypothetical protein
MTLPSVPHTLQLGFTPHSPLSDTGALSFEKGELEEDE